MWNRVRREEKEIIRRRILTTECMHEDVEEQKEDFEILIDTGADDDLEEEEE